ncbi:MAG: LysR family transcriptional regulator [Pseudomonadota bacterium]|nr:LysR family transcriptional regulator [Comamonadaceae bacterium]
MRRYLPSTAMLQAFEASARRLSFTLAAEDLYLTQGAISKQVGALEELLRTELFKRVKKRLELTAAGKSFLARIVPALNGIEAAVIELMSSQSDRSSLDLGVVPSFATKWLIPRLGDFAKSHPGVTINLATRLVPFDFGESTLDAAIHFGKPDWPGATCDYLMSEEMVVVCNEDLAAHTLQAPADLHRLSLLHLSSRPQAWNEWAATAALDGLDTTRGPHFDSFSMVAQAAVAGLGVAVLPKFLILDELASGRLVIPFGPTATSDKGYYLVYPERKARLSSLQRFRAWLMESVGEGQRQPR